MCDNSRMSVDSSSSPFKSDSKSTETCTSKSWYDICKQKEEEDERADKDREENKIIISPPPWDGAMEDEENANLSPLVSENEIVCFSFRLG